VYLILLGNYAFRLAEIILAQNVETWTTKARGRVTSSIPMSATIFFVTVINRALEMSYSLLNYPYAANI
jgi:hypothetical protein